MSGVAEVLSIAVGLLSSMLGWQHEIVYEYTRLVYSSPSVQVFLETTHGRTSEIVAQAVADLIRMNVEALKNRNDIALEYGRIQQHRELTSSESSLLREIREERKRLERNAERLGL